MSICLMCQPETTLKDIYFAIINTVHAEANISFHYECDVMKMLSQTLLIYLN